MERACLIAKAVFEAANGNRFFNVLREHLRQNLPHLIIPVSLEIFRQSPGGWEALTSFSRMVEAERNGPQKRYEAEIARLGRVSDELRIVRQRGEERLHRPLADLEEAVRGSLETEEAINSALQRWEGIARNLERAFGMPEYSLAPLWIWR